MSKSKRERPELLKMSFTVFGYSIGLAFISLMFAPLMMSEITALRLAFTAALLLIATILYYTTGSYKGERDCANRDMLVKRAKEKGETLQPEEIRRFYNPPKGILAAFLGSLPWLLLSIAVAILAVPYTYTLQDLPSWLSGYQALPEVGNALLYYNQPITIPLVSTLEPVVRFIILPFVFLIGETNDAITLWIARLSPLMVMALPLCYAIGYLRGPQRYKHTLSYIAEVKSRPRKRLKKKDPQKGPKKEEKNQLV